MPSNPAAVVRSEVAVIGTGPAGLATALALAAHDLDVVSIGPTPDAESLARETRTTALFGGSIDLLRHLGVWDALAPFSEPLIGLRLIDDTGGLLRAPETLFRASEIGRPAFGYNIENRRLIAALLGRVPNSPALRHLPTSVSQLSTGPQPTVGLALADGRRVEAALIVGADGRHSRARTAAGIATQSWSYPQVALATVFTHSRAHDGISSELHRRHGPLTTVPMPGKASSLVWVETPTEADRLADLTDDAFVRQLEERLGGLLGAVMSLGPRGRFPLAGFSAKPLARNRIALVGEAGHVLPPIGAQGLNLGFRDAAWIADIAGEAKATGHDIGSGSVLESYARARDGDVATRSLAVDLLNRSLFEGLPPLDMMRGAGLALLDAVPWLRRPIIKAGLGPGGPRPRLLQPG